MKTFDELSLLLNYRTEFKKIAWAEASDALRELDVAPGYRIPYAIRLDRKLWGERKEKIIISHPWWPDTEVKSWCPNEAIFYTLSLFLTRNNTALKLNVDYEIVETNSFIWLVLKEHYCAYEKSIVSVYTLPIDTVEDAITTEKLATI